MHTKKTIKIWDVVVIGGGPAGMMAAGTAGNQGKSVLLLEKNDTLGKKLLITGGGRCNITNNKPDSESLVSSFKNRPKALFSLFSQFGVDDTINFFEGRGLKLKEEAAARMFPVTDKAESVWQVMLDYMKQNNVKIRTNAAVISLKVRKDRIFEIKTTDRLMLARSCIVATGGTSHPKTGSTGDAYPWLNSLGHNIVKNNLGLVPIALKDPWSKKLAGVALSDIKLSVYSDTKKQFTKAGKLIFTHFGISGPAVLNISKQVGEMLSYSKVRIDLDMLPQLDFSKLNQNLTELFTQNSNKKIKNVLSALIPATVAKTIIELAEIDPDTFCHSVKREQRMKLMQLIKAIPLHVTYLLGKDRAVISAGGADVKEINFKTMESRLIPKLYLIGDLINIDRPSGGYSLQLCWSAGFVAGTNAANSL